MSTHASTGGQVPPAIVTSTACGLDFWSRMTSLPPVVVTGQTWAELTDLQPNTAYQIGVAATCSNPCWAANRVVRGDSNGVKTVMILGGSGGLGAPGYETQRLAYTVGGAMTGDGGAPTSEGTPVGVIAAAVSVSVLAAAVGLFAFCRYRSFKRADHAYQYARPIPSLTLSRYVWET